MLIKNPSLINFEESKKVLKIFYDNNGLESFFTRDIDYLEKAYYEIFDLWGKNFEQIKTINYLMIAEAPLWGSNKNYIYNPVTNNSQFFFRSDLSDVIGEEISTKQEFLKTCIKIGLIVIDISPYPLNRIDTIINYSATNEHSKCLNKRLYRELVKLTLPDYFKKKIELIRAKKSKNIKVFFRYKRIKDNFEDLIIPTLIKHEFIKSKEDIGDVSKKGGCIDKLKLSSILKIH